MTQLDDFLGGAPRQFTEFQNNESTTFMGYFKPGIKYKVGQRVVVVGGVNVLHETFPRRPTPLWTCRSQ